MFCIKFNVFCKSVGKSNNVQNYECITQIKSIKGYLLYYLVHLQCLRLDEYSE